MNAERLLALYEKVADAPDAVPRLRRFVLDLAVRGKLVPQDAGDEPASELLKWIASEKARLVKAGKIRKSRKEAERSTEDPHKLPKKWIWVPFGELHHLVRGVTYSKGDVSKTASAGFVPILRANNIGSTLTHDDPVYVKSDRVSPDQYLRRGDYMIALSSGSKNLVGKAALVPDDLDEAFGGFCGAVRLFDPSLVGFVGVFLSSDLYRNSISAGSRGIGINNLKKEVLANLHFPLPPLAEQRRIVGSVEELIALLDRLEAARTAREATRDRLTAASLARLTASDTGPDANAPGALSAEGSAGSASGNATNQAVSGEVDTGFPSDTAKKADSFPANARFALATLPALTTRPDQIKPLRQTILNLAVRGKLVAQDPTDEPASELLKRIAVAKAAIKGRKGARTRNEAASIAPSGMTIPHRWESVRLDAISTFENGDRSSNYPSGPDIKSEGIPFFSTKNLSDYRLGSTDLDFISPEKFSSLRSGKLKDLDILITLRGSVGKFGLFKASEHITTGFINAQLLIIRCLDPEIVPYLVTFMQSDDFEQQIALLSSGAATPQLSAGKLAEAMIPLPPLAEQHRIVAKVDALMALCDRLEAALTIADTTRARLLEALLHEALAPSAEAVTEAAE